MLSSTNSNGWRFCRWHSPQAQASAEQADTPRKVQGALPLRAYRRVGSRLRWLRGGSEREDQDADPELAAQPRRQGLHAGGDREAGRHPGEVPASGRGGGQRLREHDLRRHVPEGAAEAGLPACVQGQDAERLLGWQDLRGDGQSTGLGDRGCAPDQVCALGASVQRILRVFSGGKRCRQESRDDRRPQQHLHARLRRETEQEQGPAAGAADWLQVRLRPVGTKGRLLRHRRHLARAGRREVLHQ